MDDTVGSWGGLVVRLGSARGVDVEEPVGRCPNCDVDVAGAVCPQCGAVIRWDLDGTVQLNVQGTSADEVSTVASDLAERVRLEQARRWLASPWLTGSFYLTVAVIVVVLLLSAARFVSLWALPLVVAGGIALVVVVSVSQLRQDGRLDEQRFATLVGDVVAHLPLLLKRAARLPTPKTDADADGDDPTT